MVGSGAVGATGVSSLFDSTSVVSPLSWALIEAVAPKRRHARPSVVPEVVLNLSPIPQPPPPVDSTWQPQFPAHPQRHRQRRFAEIAYTPQPPLFQLGWLPILPSHPQRRPPPHPAYVIMGDVGAEVVIPTLTAWQTVPTAPIRRRPQRFQDGVYPIAMTTLLNAAPCIELTAETVVSPLLTAEAVVSPSMTTETLVSPVLTEEDLC